MRKILIIWIIYSLSCTPKLKIKGNETYKLNTVDCDYKLVLNKSSTFEYSYKCLGILKLNQGTWLISKDTIYFKSKEKTRVEDVLSSSYLAELPNFGLILNNKEILINNIRLKASL
ncbi:MAG TPA: hypothetical protein PKD32_08320 [Saprospiraceae bacterium]|nr:hypothetical protein [Saprospiraceae bacterium]